MATTAAAVTSSSSRTTLTIVSCLFVISCCLKVLLFPAYRSTDLDVHRHWKAVTRNLARQDWYFDNAHVDTVHTLDYPPGFAFLEYCWANNPLTSYLLDSGSLDARCLWLLPDTDNVPSPACVAYLRSTVLVSDAVLWLAAAAISVSVTASTDTKDIIKRWIIFGLIVFHPALLWLDHVHFQYNGLLLGLLLLSVACLLAANNNNNNNTTTTPPTTVRFHVYHIAAAATFALLLTLKHLYLILAPWYFFYLYRRYVLADASRNNRVRRLLVLGSVTVLTLLVPVLPFVTTATTNRLQQLQQIGRRLFPFGRGLVHDYWAGNVWALHQAANKVLGVLQLSLVLPDVSPTQCAVILLLCLSPGCWYAWQAAAAASAAGSGSAKYYANQGILLSISYSALVSFLTAYHVHEKAVVTTLLPLTVWAVVAAEQDAGAALALLTQTTAAAVLGLAPLLFRPVELCLKLCTLIPYLAVLGYYQRRTSAEAAGANPQRMPWWTVTWIVPVWALVEVVPVSVWGRYEFVPLAVTSVSVAVAMLVSFARITRHMMFDRPKVKVI